MFRFNQAYLKTKEKIGKGRFGTVFPYQQNETDFKWVVKRVIADDVDHLLSSLPEIVIGFSCDHPRVVPVKGYFIKRNSEEETFQIYMKLPRMGSSLLQDFAEKKAQSTPYTEEEIIQHFYSLVCGLGYLHRREIYHGDIKPDNLLFDEKSNLYLADIGIAKRVEEEDSNQVITKPLGTYQYSAPEIIIKGAKKELLSKADVWSVGVIILELCKFDFHLFNSPLASNERQIKLNDHFKSLQGRYKDSLIFLIKRSLSLNPQDRPDIEEIKTELEKNFSKVLVILI